ncbi:MAG: glycoside hydrolase family 9 protein [Flavobacteriales bacterium]|nr:glycoside hydrolase family 9 protein [Flavobacteriales bacterium]
MTTTGSYYVHDPISNTRSHRLEIDDCVYTDVLTTALRAFYYQRCGTDKPAAYAGAGWSDPSPCHVDADQDLTCRLVTNPLPANERDLHGGWHDAGDHNKYVNWTYGVLSDLLLAYWENPGVWGDDSGIPESGNGVPDLLDEVKYELDWLLRMRQPDGPGSESGGDHCLVGADQSSQRGFERAAPLGPKHLGHLLHGRHVCARQHPVRCGGPDDLCAKTS